VKLAHLPGWLSPRLALILRTELGFPSDKDEIEKYNTRSQRTLDRTDYFLKILGWTSAAAALNKYAFEHKDKLIGNLSFGLFLATAFLLYFWLTTQITYPPSISRRGALLKYYIGTSISIVIALVYIVAMEIILHRISVL